MAKQKEEPWPDGDPNEDFKGVCHKQPNTPREMTKEEKKEAKEIRTRALKRVKKYMTGVRAYLKERNGGKIEATWELDLNLLEDYYLQYCIISEQIAGLDSIISPSRYGFAPSPLLGARDRTAMRLADLQKSLGLSLKAGRTMNLVEPVREESAVEAFLKGHINGKDED